ncbi:hypothetical protein BJF85_20520 [Saccharomonospora sp. CUA-673]|uniref:hypothetical protein n=1 Tax=Saccharomonospora sp. CUA-673 TaxID=1904969 RepID=UPI000963489B|nr:hypothetical protein [Saccharomonospora sp. CUA-673]OLT44095.1 hypothetical protein BJF85_20520 [Saccharomonospora sp. CUA-673]
MFVLEGVERAERPLEIVAGDLVVLDVETSEDGLVEQAPLLFITPSVELLRVFEEFQRGLDELGVVGEVGVGCLEAAGEFAAFGVDLAELVLDLGSGHGAVGHEVDHVGLLSVEFL